MTEFVVESKRLIDIFEKALINKQLDKASAYLTQDSMHVSDISQKVVGVICIYRPPHFKQYHNIEPTEFMITKDMLDGLEKLRFSQVELVTVSIQPDVGKITFTGSDNSKKWETNLSAINKSEETGLSQTRIPWGIRHEAGVGLLPETGDILSQFSLPVDKLTIPDVEQVSISTTQGGDVILECDYKGQFTDKVVPTAVRKTADIKKTVTVDYLKKALSNFTGVVWFTLYEQALILTQTNPDYELFYVQSVI